VIDDEADARLVVRPAGFEGSWARLAATLARFCEAAFCEWWELPPLASMATSATTAAVSRPTPSE
jgi:hypothetical protein